MSPSMMWSALVQKLLLGELGVGRGSGMDHQTLHIRNVGKEGEDLQIVDELPSLVLTALDLKGKDRAAAVGEILLIERVVGMIRERGMIDLLHLGMFA